MKEEIIIAGFGGQGVLSMGKILAYSGIMQGREVTWMPSYGPEMRGGTANVTVILSDDRISSPIVHEFDTAIILNQQSLDKFEPMVKRGGLLLYDPNGTTAPPTRADITICRAAATAEAAKMGNAKVFNMIVLGAFLKVKPVVKLENVVKGLQKSLPERARKLIPMNEQAMLRGMEIAEELKAAASFSAERGTPCRA
jgi:2-oxoglutarate ferredoxin oxidoreductase subunit gamma